MDRTSGVVHLLDARQPGSPRQRPQPTATREFFIAGWLVQPLLNRLTRDDVIVRVRPQLMDLLVCLADQPGRVLTRDDLVARVWEGRWVGDSAVSRSVAELRAVFADDAQRPRVIETISKRGYRLIAPVEPAPASSSGASATPHDAATARPIATPGRVRRWFAGIARRWLPGSDQVA